MNKSDEKRVERLAERMVDMERVSVTECADGTAMVIGRIRGGLTTTIFSSIKSFALAKEIALAAYAQVHVDRLPDVLRFSPRAA